MICGDIDNNFKTILLDFGIAKIFSEPGEVSVDQGVPAPTAADGAFEVVAALPPGLMEQQVTLRLLPLLWWSTVVVPSSLVPTGLLMFRWLSSC